MVVLQSATFAKGSPGYEDTTFKASHQGQLDGGRIEWKDFAERNYAHLLKHHKQQRVIE